MKSPTFNDVQVVGMHFREREGVPAKSIVAGFVPPEEGDNWSLDLELEREPENPHDQFAVKVFYEGQHIGYIERGTAAFLATHMDDGQKYACRVKRLEEARNNLYPVCTLEPVTE